MANKLHFKSIKHDKAKELGIDKSDYEEKNNSEWVEVASTWEKEGEYGDYTQASINIKYLESLIEEAKKEGYKNVNVNLNKVKSKDSDVIDPSDLPF